MVMVAVAAGVGLAVVISFAAGAFLGLYAAGKIPDKKKPEAAPVKAEEQIDGKPTIEKQIEELFGYGGISSADRRD